MNIELDPAEDEDFRILVDFGPYSINAEAYEPGLDGWFLIMHDSGAGVVLRCDEATLRRIAADARVPEDVFEPLRRKVPRRLFRR